MNAARASCLLAIATALVTGGCEPGDPPRPINHADAAMDASVLCPNAEMGTTYPYDAWPSNFCPVQLCCEERRTALWGCTEPGLRQSLWCPYGGQ